MSEAFLVDVSISLLCSINTNDNRRSVIEPHSNQSSGVKKAETTAHNAHDSGPNFESIRNLSAV